MNKSIQFSSEFYGRTDERRSKAQAPGALVVNLTTPTDVFFDKELPKCSKCGAYMSSESALGNPSINHRCNFCGTDFLQIAPFTNIPDMYTVKLEPTSKSRTIFLIDASSTSKNSGFLYHLLHYLPQYFKGNTTEVAFILVSNTISVIHPNGKILTYPDIKEAIIPPSAFFKGEIPSLIKYTDAAIDFSGPDIIEALKVCHRSGITNGKIIVFTSFRQKGVIDFQPLNTEAENSILKGVNYSSCLLNLQEMFAKDRVQIDFMVLVAGKLIIDVSSFSLFAVGLGGRLEIINQYQIPTLYEQLANLMLPKVVGSVRLSSASIMPSLGMFSHSPQGFSTACNSSLVFPFKFDSKSNIDRIVAQVNYITIYPNGQRTLTVITSHALGTDDISRVFSGLNCGVIHKYITASLISMFFNMGATFGQMPELALGLMKPLVMSYRMNGTLNPNRLSKIVLPSAISQLPLLVHGILKSTPFTRSVSFDERAGHFAKLNEMTPEELELVAIPKLFDVTAFVSRDEPTVQLQFNSSSVSASKLAICQYGFGNWLWIGASTNRDLIKSAFGEVTPERITEIKEIDTEQNKRLRSLIKGVFRWTVGGSNAQECFMSRIPGVSCPEVYSFEQFIGNLHQVTLPK